jgi:hypothetical protein
MKCTAQVTLKIIVRLTQPWDTSKPLNEVFDGSKREAQRKVSQLLTAAGDEMALTEEATVKAIMVTDE